MGFQRERGQKRELRKIVTAECRFGARVPGSSAAVRTKTLASKGAINCLDLSPTSQRHQRAALIYGSKLTLEGTMTASLSSAAPADIPPAADAAAFQPRSRVGVVATGARPAPPAPRTATGLAFGDAPASVPAPPAPVVAAPSLSGTTIPAHQLSETTEVQQARVAAQLAEARLYGAIVAGGAFDAELKKLQLEVASSKLALAEASGEPADRVENLSDKVVVANVLPAAATAKDKDAVVAFIRGDHLFMNNPEVDYVRKLSPSERNETIKQCGAHVKLMHIEPGKFVVRPSAPAMYREFFDKYPDLRLKPVANPRLVKATTANLATIEQIKTREDEEIRYTSDMAQWGKPQQWDAGETGKGDCEDFATFALKRCMEAGFPREAATRCSRKTCSTAAVSAGSPSSIHFSKAQLERPDFVANFRHATSPLVS
jgi:Bacterial transglutaminase-like cysteine proteinase BTLCP